MKLNEYFRTPRGYKRLAMVPAVAIIAALTAWFLTFFMIGISELHYPSRWLALGMPLVYFAIWLIAIIVKKCKKQPRKRFSWFCGWVFVLLYFCTYFYILAVQAPLHPTEIGCVTEHGLYNKGICKLKWGKEDCMYIAKYYNKYAHQRCYVVLFNHNFYSNAPERMKGLMEIDIYDMNLNLIDGCMVELAPQGKGKMELGDYLDKYVGVYIGRVMGESKNAWKRILEDGDLYSYYTFEDRDGNGINASAEAHPDATNLHWWDYDRYNEKHNTFCTSFMHLGVIPVNYPALVGK